MQKLSGVHFYINKINTIRPICLNEYKELVEKGTAKAFNNELVTESWHNSGVCMKKMKRYRRGVICSGLAIAFALLSFFAHFLMYRCCR